MFLSFKCEKCGSKVRKIATFKDVFDIKEGKTISCLECNTGYAVNSIIATFFKTYYLFVWGIVPINFLIIAYFLGIYFGVKGLLTLTISSIIIYYVIEFILALLIPLKVKSTSP
jgi:hypothetical protein